MNKRQRKKQRTVRMRRIHKMVRRVYAAVGNGTASVFVIGTPVYSLEYDGVFFDASPREVTP